jgi:hypothetical protein
MGEDVVIVQEVLCHGEFENLLLEFECCEVILLTSFGDQRLGSLGL